MPRGTASADRLEPLIDELLSSPPGLSGEWLRRLGARIRPRRLEGARIAIARLRALTLCLGARPELASALGTDPVLLQYLLALTRPESPFIAQAGEVRGLTDRVEQAVPGADDRHPELLLDQYDGYRDAVRRRSRAAGAGFIIAALALLKIGIARLDLPR